MTPRVGGTDGGSGVLELGSEGHLVGAGTWVEGLRHSHGAQGRPSYHHHQRPCPRQTKGRRDLMSLLLPTSSRGPGLPW